MQQETLSVRSAGFQLDCARSKFENQFISLLPNGLDGMLAGIRIPPVIEIAHFVHNYFVKSFADQK